MPILGSLYEWPIIHAVFLVDIAAIDLDQRGHNLTDSKEECNCSPVNKGKYSLSSKRPGFDACFKSNLARSESSVSVWVPQCAEEYPRKGVSMESGEVATGVMRISIEMGKR